MPGFLYVLIELLLLHQLAAGQIDRALLHGADPLQAPAAAVGHAGVRIVRDGAGDLRALGNELVKAAHAISENVSECDGGNDINGGLFSVRCRNDALLLSAYNTKINISSAGKAQTDMINILWDKSRYISAGTPCFLINRYQKASNGISLYFTECELRINEDGITARCNYR